MLVTCLSNSISDYNANHLNQFELCQSAQDTTDYTNYKDFTFILKNIHTRFTQYRIGSCLTYYSEVISIKDTYDTTSPHLRNLQVIFHLNIVDGSRLSTKNLF